MSCVRSRCQKDILYNRDVLTETEGDTNTTTLTYGKEFREWVRVVVQLQLELNNAKADMLDS